MPQSHWIGDTTVGVIAAGNCASAVATAMNQVERLLLNELWEWQGSRKK